MTRPDQIAAERIVIGAALRAPATRFRVARNVNACDFTDPHHRAIYDAVEDQVINQGKPCDLEAIGAAADVDAQTLVHFADAERTLIDLDEAIAVMTGYPVDLEGIICAGAVLADITRRMTLDETWITRDELTILVGGHAGELRAEERRLRDRAAEIARRSKLPWMQVSSTEVDGLSKSVYADGKDPIEWAEFLAATRIETAEQVAAARALDPAAYPGYVLELTPEASGRSIVGLLLDAGWRPPTLPADTAAGGQP